MKLIGELGTSVEVRIQGYQFPHLAAKDYDSNWLRILVHVGIPAGEWTAEDPCMLTYEVERLAACLEAVAEGTNTRDSIGFIEPNLELRVIDERILRIYFELECRPPWVHTPSAGLEDVWADISINQAALRRAAADLRAALYQFPQRTER